MSTYVTKAEHVEALQITADASKWSTLIKFAGIEGLTAHMAPGFPMSVTLHFKHTVMHCDAGDWVVKTADGEFKIFTDYEFKNRFDFLTY